MLKTNDPLQLLLRRLRRIFEILLREMIGAPPFGIEGDD